MFSFAFVEEKASHIIHNQLEDIVINYDQISDTHEPCEEVLISSHSLNDISTLEFKTIQINDNYSIKYHLFDSNKHFTKGYDLVKGEYEGGGTIWECSIDLVRYLVEHSTELINK